MKYRNDRILTYIGMADAYAAMTEYLKFPRDNNIKQQALRFTGYGSHPTHQNHPGLYTDDAEMGAANGHVLQDFDPPYKPIQFTHSYVKQFEFEGKRNGYARNFQAFLELVKTGAEFLEKIQPFSNKNGAIMRAPIIGVLKTIPEVLETATVQAQTTHATHEGTFSARAGALMAHFALYEEDPLCKLPDYCLSNLPPEDVSKFGYVFTKRWPNEPVKHSTVLPVAISTTHAVADLVINQKSLMNILRTAIMWGGDTDSVAAVAWGIASSRYQHENLPEFMWRDLEGGNAKTGTPYLDNLSKQLMNKFSK